MKISKARLIILRGNKCEICGISEWQGKRITFDEHHCDRNRENIVESNRIILCPNCHRQQHLERSEEFKRKLSKAALGNTYCKGRKLSEEHKQKIREANSGRPCSDKTRQKMSLTRKGKHHSEETRMKISRALLLSNQV